MPASLLPAGGSCSCTRAASKLNRPAGAVTRGIDRAAAGAPPRCGRAAGGLLRGWTRGLGGGTVLGLGSALRAAGARGTSRCALPAAPPLRAAAREVPRCAPPPPPRCAHCSGVGGAGSGVGSGMAASVRLAIFTASSSTGRVNSSASVTLRGTAWLARS